MAHRRKKIHHRRTHTRGGTSYKMLGFAGLAGVAAVVAAGYLEIKVDWVRQHWYAAPLVVGLGGLVLAKRMPTVGIALVAIAGGLAYAGYNANAMAQNKGGSAAGLTDAGYGGWRQGARMGAARDSGLYESGALMGQASRPLISAQAGALMGPVGRQLFQDQGAGALYGSREIEGG